MRGFYFLLFLISLIGCQNKVGSEIKTKPTCDAALGEKCAPNPTTLKFKVGDGYKSYDIDQVQAVEFYLVEGQTKRKFEGEIEILKALRPLNLFNPKELTTTTEVKATGTLTIYFKRELGIPSGIFIISGSTLYDSASNAYYTAIGPLTKEWLTGL